MARTPPDDPLLGTRIGNYEVVGLLGRGGMGAVYEARHPLLGRAVAIKVLTARLDDPGSQDRFQREALAAARIGHAAIVEVTDFGELNDGRAYYVMERLHGESLRQRLEREGALPLSEVARIADGVLDGLSAAHDAGIVHRDLKPDNVFLQRRTAAPATPRLLDFGIAKLLRAEGGGGAVTRTGQLLGTPLYMAPEQASERLGDVGPWTDVYAAGAMLFHLLTGDPPYQAPAVGDLLLQHLQAPIPSARQRRPEVPVALDAVIRQALAKRPAERFTTVGALRSAFRASVHDALPAPPWGLDPAPGKARAPGEEPGFPEGRALARTMPATAATGPTSDHRAASVTADPAVFAKTQPLPVAPAPGDPREPEPEPTADPGSDPAVAPTAIRAAPAPVTTLPKRPGGSGSPAPGAAEPAEDAAAGPLDATAAPAPPDATIAPAPPDATDATEPTQGAPWAPKAAHRPRRRWAGWLAAGALLGVAAAAAALALTHFRSGSGGEAAGDPNPNVTTPGPTGQRVADAGPSRAGLPAGADAAPPGPSEAPHVRPTRIPGRLRAEGDGPRRGTPRRLAARRAGATRPPRHRRVRPRRAAPRRATAPRRGRAAPFAAGPTGDEPPPATPATRRAARKRPSGAPTRRPAARRPPDRRVAARRPPARSGETYRYRGRTFPKPPGVDAALRRYRSDLRWCAQLLLKRNPGDRSKRIRITLNVTAHGRVSHVYVSGEVDRWRMAWCLKRRASRWRLPAQRLWYTHQFHMTL